MPPLLIPCPHCAQPSRIDSAKLPDRPAYFPCPHCKGRVVVDKRKLMSGPAQPSARASAPTPETVVTPPAVEPTAPDRRFATVPTDAILPSGIVVGDNEATIGEIREALAAMGSEVEHVDSPDAARQLIVNEQPDLCIYVAGAVDAAPHAAMSPLTGLQPSLRRRLYLMLVADNLRSFDGNAAFLHEVNLVLGTRDVSRIGAALYGGLEHHDRLYRAYRDATERKGSL